MVRIARAPPLANAATEPVYRRDIAAFPIAPGTNPTPRRLERDDMQAQSAFHRFDLDLAIEAGPCAFP